MNAFPNVSGPMASTLRGGPTSRVLLKSDQAHHDCHFYVAFKVTILNPISPSVS
jgi:hypothetical protein